MTPPLILRSESGSAPECVEVDHEIITTERLTSGRVRAYLTLGPELRVSVGSRCVNKRRIATLTITAKDCAPPPNETGHEIAQVRNTMNGGQQ